MNRSFVRRAEALARAGALLGVVAVAGCEAGPPETIGPCAPPKQCPALDGAVADGPATPAFDAPPSARPTDLVSIELAPALVALEARGATLPTQAFRVTGRQRDGRTRDVTSMRRFSLDVAAMGSINPDSGVFTSNGVGGATPVRVAMLDGSGLSAQASLTVNARSTTLAEVTEAERARFDALRPTGAVTETPTLDYPLARAVMPQNVYPPLVQWTQRHPDREREELWRVRLARPHAVVEAYLRSNPDFPNSWRPPRDAWRALAQADLSSPITLTVAVLSRGVLRESEARLFRTADAVIAGSVYYWSPDRARLRRVEVDEARLVDFLPDPGDTCIGCHTVSRDGRRLSGYLETTHNSVALYDLTRDLAVSPVPLEARVPSTARRCTSFNPDGSRMVSGDCGANPSMTAFTLLDGRTAMPLPAAGSLGDGYDPEWSPDGQLIAYTDRADALAVTPATAGDAFGAPTTLHAPPTSGATVDWHPTWSPDSRWIVFQRGVARRTGTGAGSLWSLPRAGGAPVRLTNLANGADETSYRPQFSPFNSGGYFWLLFTSSRNYGNANAGVRDQKQIWISAVRNRPEGTADPSEVAYYLDGQERITCLSPQWAPAPCRATGAACATGPDCCTGVCEPDSAGRNTCVPPRNTCIARGGRCNATSDCCMGLVCGDGRLCDYPPPG